VDKDFSLFVRVGEDGLNLDNIGSHLGLPTLPYAHGLLTLVQGGLAM